MKFTTFWEHTCVSVILGVGPCRLSSNPVLPQSRLQVSDLSWSSCLHSLLPVGATILFCPCCSIPVVRKDGPKEEHARERTEKASGCAELAPTGSWEIRHAFLPTIMYSHFRWMAENWSWREYLCYHVHTPWHTQHANKLRDKLLEQGIAALFRKPTDQEYGRLASWRTILPGFGYWFLSQNKERWGEEAKLKRQK